MLLRFLPSWCKVMNGQIGGSYKNNYIFKCLANADEFGVCIIEQGAAVC